HQPPTTSHQPPAVDPQSTRTPATKMPLRATKLLKPVGETIWVPAWMLGIWIWAFENRFKAPLIRKTAGATWFPPISELFAMPLVMLSTLPGPMVTSPWMKAETEGTIVLVPVPTSA